LNIVPGDDLWSIAEAHKIPLALLESENPQIVDFNSIVPGEVINLPLATGIKHVVVEGDTLYNLAIEYNVDFACLEAANKQIPNPDYITPGQVINIPNNCPPFQVIQLPPTTSRISLVGKSSVLSSETSKPTLSLPSIVSTSTGFITITSTPTLTSVTSISGSEVTVTLSSGAVGGTGSSAVGGGSSLSSGAGGGSAITSGAGDGSAINSSPTNSAALITSEIIIQGSAYTLGPIPQTITLADNQTLVIGPTGIIIGSSTFALPTITGSAETVITLNGETLTLGNFPAPPVTSSNGTALSTITTPQILSTPEVVVIDGSSYTLGPLPSTIVDNGTTFVIGGDGGGVTVGSITFTDFPTGTATLVSGSIVITVGPAPSITLATGDPAIIGLQPQATQVVQAVAAAAAEVGSYVSLTEDSASAAAKLEDVIASASSCKSLISFFLTGLTVYSIRFICLCCWGN
jgi:LysM repeat protein